MATITIEIGRGGKNGQHAVCYLIRHGGKKKRISTGISVKDDELTANGKRIKDPAKSVMLEKRRVGLQEKLNSLSLEIMGQKVDVAYIAERLAHSIGVLDFFQFADKWLARSARKGNKNYKCFLNALEAYNGSRSLSFGFITYPFLQGFEDYLRGKPRAQSMYLGQFRHLYHEAMRTYNTDYDSPIKNDPFMRYQVPKEKVRKGVRALTLEQLYKIRDYKGIPGGRAQLARDCFILSFSLMGMNSVDMFAAKDMTGGVLRYKREKTKDRRSDEAYIEVKIHPCISDLMKKYKGAKRVFSISERYSTPANFNQALNKGLKEVGEAVGIEGLQFYQARHTFATLSRNMMHFSKGDVDEALNHVGSYDVADIYIVKDFSVINENNFKLLDRVFGKS